MEDSVKNQTDADGSRAKLINVARKLFAEKGLDGTSTRDIAKEAGVNISLISYYFGGKEGLYTAVIEAFAQQASQRMEMLFSTLDLENLDKKGFKTAMQGILNGMIRMKIAEPDINTILQREMMSGMPYAAEIFNTVMITILEKITSLYRQGQKKGFVKKEINPYVLFLSLAHSSDVFVRIGKCNTHVNKKVPKLPEQVDEYIEQLYLIFVEGVII